MKDYKGFGSISNNRDPHSFYIGRWTEVYAQNEVSVGVYRGTEEGYLILHPHIIVERFPIDENKSRTMFFLSESPKMISAGTITSVGDIREEHIQSMLNNKRIILPRL